MNSHPAIVTMSTFLNLLVAKLTTSAVQYRLNISIESTPSMYIRSSAILNLLPPTEQVYMRNMPHQQEYHGIRKHIIAINKIK